MKSLAVALVVLSLACLSGCASADYAKYADAQSAMQVARSNAEAARYTAMADIAQTGDTTARVAAMMAMMGMGQSQGQAVTITPPRTSLDYLMRFAEVVVPTAAYAYSAHVGGQVAMNASNNAAATAISTNGAFVGMAGQIQTPAANVTTTTTTNTSTATDSHNTATDSHNTATDSHNTSSTSNIATDSHNTATDNHAVSGSYNPYNYTIPASVIAAP